MVSPCTGLHNIFLIMIDPTSYPSKAGRTFCLPRGPSLLENTFVLPEKDHLEPMKYSVNHSEGQCLLIAHD